MESKNKLSTTELAVALYNIRFVKDKSNAIQSHTSSSSSEQSITSSLTSTALSTLSYSKFDLNPRAIQSLFIRVNHNDFHDEQDAELPLYKQITLDKESSILYFPENSTKAFNYSDWDKLIDLMNKHADPNIITIYKTWHGMEMIGIDTYIRYLMKLVESKPDLTQCIDVIKTIGNVIEAKVSFSFTDCYDIHEQLYQSNRNRDVLTSNTTCARTLRLLPLIDLKKKSSAEIRKILDILESDEDLLLTGVTFKQFIVDSKTHKLIQLRLDPHILSINVKPKAYYR